MSIPNMSLGNSNLESAETLILNSETPHSSLNSLGIALSSNYSEQPSNLLNITSMAPERRTGIEIGENQEMQSQARIFDLLILAINPGEYSSKACNL